MATNGLTLDDLQIKISINAEEASRSIRNLARSIEGLRSLRIDGLNMLIRQLGRLNEQSYNVRTLASSIRELSTELNRISGTTRAMTAIAESTQQTSTACDQLAGTVNVAARETNEVAAACNSASREVNKLGNEAKNTGKHFDKASKGGIANFFASIKRIAMYRAIRSALKFLTNAIKEGFEMFVTWDREQNNFMAGTAMNVDKLTERWTMLKGQIGALGGALFNGLAPVIIWVVDQITKLVDLLQMVVRSLQGEYSYYRLIYKSAKATTGQAKELKRILFGFDELNVLNSPGGGGGTSSGGSWFYEELPIDNKFLNGIADVSNKIKELTGASDDAQKSFGLLAAAVGLLLGGKAFGSLLGLLPRLISGFRDKNKVLQDQTTSTANETAKVGALAGAFGLALAGAKGFKTYLDNNPMQTNIRTAVDFSGANALLTGLTVLQAFVQANPISIALTVPFKALANAFESFRNNMQRYFNNNPISIATRAAGGAAQGYGYSTYGAGKQYDDTKYTANMGSAISSAASASNFQTIVNTAFEEYEANAWRSEWLGTDTAKTVGALGVGVLGTAVAAIAGVGAALAEFFSTLGLQSILGFANGGVPDIGTLFYAGEAGAEVVANMGHSTGVMNVDQMEAAVANGNIEVINAIYAMANMVTGAVNNKNFDVYMDAQKVGKSVTQYQHNVARQYGG